MQTARLSAAEFRASPLAGPKAVRKYRNVPTVVDGIRFDSRKEAARWGELKLLERAGEITELERQRSFPMTVNGVPVCVYRADFTYLDHSGALVVEDVKSEATRKDPVYRVKAKLLLAVHGLGVREI